MKNPSALKVVDLGPAEAQPDVKAPNTLPEIEEHVRLLGMVTRDLIWAWDLRTRKVVRHSTFVEVLGESPPNHPASMEWWKSRVHPDDLPRVMEIYDRALADGSDEFSCEYRLRDRSGTYLTVEDRAHFLRDLNGEVIRIFGAVRDITKRRRAEEAQARLTRIINATTDLVGMATVEGEPFFLNAAGRAMIGLAPDDPLPSHLSKIHPEWANEIVFKEGRPTAIQNGYWKGETALLHRDGHEIPVSQVILSHPDANGKIEFTSTIMRDLSDRKHEEVARIEWANRYDAAIRASGQVLFDWNSFTNEITYAGDVDRLFGCSMAEMQGGLERFRQLIHPADLPAFDEEVQRIITTRDPFDLQFRARRADGGFIYLEAKGYFFLDRRGEIGRMVGFFSDITAERRAQEALTLAHEGLERRVEERTAELGLAYNLIRDHARQQEAVAQLGQRALSAMPLEALLDESMRLILSILHVDCCSLLSLAEDGTHFAARAQAGWADPASDNIVPVGRASQAGYTLLTGDPVIVENLATETRFTPSAVVARTGLMSSISVLIEGDQGPIGVLIAFTQAQRTFVPDDAHFLQSIGSVVTAAIERKAAEEAVRLSQEQAEKASRAKSEFLSRMSHELRTPLNAILGFTQLLEIDALSPSQEESVVHIARAGKHLLMLINEVLDIARIESGRLALSPEPIDLPSFLRAALDLIRPLADRHEITLVLEPAQTDGPHRVVADRQRFQQVLLNLLSNAVKYNRPAGRVTVSLGEEGDRLSISVTDTGRGIAPEKLPRLFLPFERLGAETTDIEGTGIGLALSRGIVTALHGELRVQSRVDEGSTFTVLLPRTDIKPSSGEPPVAAALAAPETKAPGTSPRLLLYIEDQDLNLRLVERIFHSRPHYRLLTAMQGGLGLDLAREHQPDLILLDINLPDMPGDEVLRRLKADPVVKKIPVLVVSADAMGDRIEQLLESGASGYLTKPYKVGEFVRVIEETLASHPRKDSTS